MLNANKVSLMKELILKIKDANKAYFVDDNPIMTDKEYDEMVEKLKALELETRIVFSGSPSKKVAGGVKKELQEVKHTKPMLSAQKTKSLDEINRFVADKDAVVSWKLDGLTIVLRYQGGFLTQAITRGRDGLVGEDVTASVRYFRNVPKRIKETRTIEVRGEGVLSWKDHKILTGDNEEASNHPRHVAAGLTRTAEPDKGRTSHIDFFAFDLIDAPYIPNSKGGQFKYMAELGFAVVPYEYYGTKSSETLEEIVQSFNPKEFYYPVDGLIFEYDDIEYGKSLGATEHHERRLMALKWEDEEIETKFKGVELITTKTGVVNIIAEFDEININGSNVSRANVHNLSKFESFEFGVGDTIKVYNANMIVPQVAENVTRSGTYQLPKYCPCCGMVLEVQLNKNGVKNLYCPNEDCIARNAQRIAHFCDKEAMGIEGLTAVMLEKLMAYGWIKNYVDLYHVEDHKDEIIKTIGFGPSTYNKIYNAVESSRKTTLGKFLAGMGIPSVSKEVANTISEFCLDSFENFEKRIEEEYKFSHISGVSFTAEKNIYNWYNDKTEQRLFRPLLRELKFGKEEKSDEKKNEFTDKQIAITGTISTLSRKDAFRLLELLGAKPTDAVSVETDYLVVGSEPGTKKIADALQYNVKIIYEKEFIEALRG